MLFFLIFKFIVLTCCIFPLSKGLLTIVPFTGNATEPVVFVSHTSSTTALPHSADEGGSGEGMSKKTAQVWWWDKHYMLSFMRIDIHSALLCCLHSAQQQRSPTHLWPALLVTYLSCCFHIWVDCSASGCLKMLFLLWFLLVFRTCIFTIACHNICRYWHNFMKDFCVTVSVT